MKTKDIFVRLDERAPMQSSFEILCTLLIDAWARRIIEFASNRDTPVQYLQDLAAGTFDDAFINGRNMKKFPPKVQAFIKHALKVHLRLVFGERDDGDPLGHYITGRYRQPEIVLSYKHDEFAPYIDNIHKGYSWAANKLLITHRSTLIHELIHAYDDFQSKGKYDHNYRSKESTSARQMAKSRDASDEQKAKAYTAYLDDPIEINARYYQTVSQISAHSHQPWRDYLRLFRQQFIGWRQIRPNEQRQLMTRLATEWLSQQSTQKPTDITPFVQKLNDKLRQQVEGPIWVSNAHGNIEISGLDRLSPSDQLVALHKAAFLADIFRIKLVTHDNTPAMREFGFIHNKGRNIDYRVSAPYVRSSPRSK